MVCWFTHAQRQQTLNKKGAKRKAQYRHGTSSSTSSSSSAASTAMGTATTLSGLPSLAGEDTSGGGTETPADPPVPGSGGSGTIADTPSSAAPSTPSFGTSVRPIAGSQMPAFLSAAMRWRSTMVSCAALRTSLCFFLFSLRESAFVRFSSRLSYFISTFLRAMLISKSILPCLRRTAGGLTTLSGPSGASGIAAAAAAAPPCWPSSAWEAMRQKAMNCGAHFEAATPARVDVPCRHTVYCMRSLHHFVRLTSCAGVWIVCILLFLAAHTGENSARQRLHKINTAAMSHLTSQCLYTETPNERQTRSPTRPIRAGRDRDHRHRRPCDAPRAPLWR